MVTKLRRGAGVFLTAVCSVALALVALGFGSVAQANTAASVPLSVVSLPGYNVSVFAKGTKAYYNPDSVEVDGNYVWIGYQNGTNPTGTDGKTSTIAQYTRTGLLVHTYSVLGRCDGLRIDPKTHLVWAMEDEDANPRLVLINPITGSKTNYVYAKTQHGGGYDDAAFINGSAFISASNPTLNSAGINTAPSVLKVTLSNGKAIVTPVLYGNSTVTDIVTNQKVTLNMTDPDSVSIDSHGNLVVDSQADAELIFIHNPGTSKQTVTRLAVGTQVDDTTWIPTAKGRLVIVDSKQNTIYTVTMNKAGFTPGNVYTEAPADSGVAGFVGQLDPTTGTIVPVIIGLTSPTGLGFIPGK